MEQKVFRYIYKMMEDKIFLILSQNSETINENNTELIKGK